MADRPVITVVVPARDAAATIGRTLDSLAAQDLGGAFEVVVCDDGSSDQTAALARGHTVGARVVASAGTGAAAARNAGIAAARADVLAFTDADCFPVSGWLRAGSDAMREAELVTGPVFADPRAARGPFDRTLEFPDGSAWYPSANLFVRRDIAGAVGGFRDVAVGDDRAGRTKWLGEDTLFAWQVRRAGGRARFAAAAIVHHAVVPRTATEFVRYRRHWRGLPQVVRAVPELRREHVVSGVFLEWRTLLFDLALAGVGLAMAGRGRLRVAGAAAALPYAAVVGRETREWPTTPAPRTALARVAADALACASLVEGSIRARTLLI